MSYTEFYSKVKERKMRKNTENLRGSPLSKATSTGGKNRELFITDAIYKWKPFKIQSILALYKQMTKQKKITELNCYMDFGHNPTIHHLELTSI